jgi:hypothetical protein
VAITFSCAELQDVIRVRGARLLSEQRQHAGHSAMVMCAAINIVVQHQLQALLAGTDLELMVGIERTQQRRYAQTEWRTGAQVHQQREPTGQQATSARN